MDRYSERKYIAFDSAIRLDGLADYIVFDRFNKLPNAFTISLFFRYREKSGTTPTRILNYEETSGNIKLVYLDILNSGGNERKLQMNFKTVSGTYSATADHIFVPNRWYHLCIASDAINLKAYAGSTLIHTSVFSDALEAQFIINSPSIKLFLGIGDFLDAYSDIDIAHLCIWSRELTQQEIIYNYRYGGAIPQQTHANAIFHAPLQAEDTFSKANIETLASSSYNPVAQASHGFVLGDCIRYNGTIWVKANGTDEAQYSDPPTIVGQVTSPNDFQYYQEGKALLTLGLISSIGTKGDMVYCQSDGTLGITPTGNFMGYIFSTTEIALASEIKLCTVTKARQYNHAKSASNAIPLEYVGEIFGKTPSALSMSDNGHPFGIPSETLIDLYGGLYRLPNNGRDYDGSSMRDEVNSWTQIEYTSPITILIDLELDSSSNGYIFEQGDSTIGQGMYMYLDAGSIKFRISSSPSNYIEVSFPAPSERFLLTIANDGSGQAGGLKLYRNHTEIQTSVLSDTLSGTIISPDPILSIGGRNNGSSEYLDGRIYAFEIKSGYSSRDEIYHINYWRSLYHKEGSGGSFLIALDMGRSPIDTMAGSPPYTVSAIGVPTPSVAREAKTLYVPITHGLKMGNSNGGLPYSVYVDLDKSDLPNENADSYTFFYSGWCVQKPLILDASTFTREHFFLITTLNTGVWDTSSRSNFANGYQNDATSNSGYPLSFVNRVNAGNGTTYSVTQMDAKYAMSQPFSMAVTYDALIGRWRSYYNGYMYDEETSITKVDFDTPSTIFRLNNLQLGSAGSKFISHHYAFSFGYWKRNLSSAEIMNLHRNGTSSNPWIYHPAHYYRYMQVGLKIWHIFNEDAIYLDGSAIKLRNVADPSGTTDGIFSGFPDLATAHSWLNPIIYMK